MIGLKKKVLDFAKRVYLRYTELTLKPEILGLLQP